MADFRRVCTPRSMGALSPYEQYAQIKPQIEAWENTRGTLSYFTNYGVIWTELAPKREKYLDALLPLIRGTAMMKIALDYYTKLGYKTKETDGTDTDNEYNIDLIGIKVDEVLVSQVKAGRISIQELNKFCIKAPQFFKKFHKDKKVRKLTILSTSLDRRATRSFGKLGDQLNSSGIDLLYVPPERVLEELPKYSVHFKELGRNQFSMHRLLFEVNRGSNMLDEHGFLMIDNSCNLVVYDSPIAMVCRRS